METTLALYSFHLCDGDELLLDAEGRNLDDPAIVAAHALRDARSIISQEALAGRIDFNMSIQVRDCRDEMVHELQFRDAVTVAGRD